MNIGLYFGSYNPIHHGHLILAQTALNETDLDYVWMVVSPQNPFKQKKNLEAAYDRLKMVELALEGHDRILPSNVEFTLPQPSYTIDTLTHLADKYRSYRFSLIMGEDNLQHLHKWKNHEAILKYYPIYVYPRYGAEPDQLAGHPQVHRFDAPYLHLSATYIRRCIKHGKAITFMVPAPVEAYIIGKGLYAH